MARFAGERLRQLREARGLTHGEVADRVGKSRQLVGLWETGGAIPGTPELLILADLFNVPPGVFFEGGEAELEREVQEWYALYRQRPEEMRPAVRLGVRGLLKEVARRTATAASASSFRLPNEEAAALAV